MIRQMIKDIKGISWIGPKTLIRRFFLVIIFLIILAAIALGAQVLGGALFKVIKG